MPYLRFPDTFPAWIPRKQIADWLEHYRSILQLPVKLGSTVTSTKWDGEAKLWTIEIEKDDSKTYFNPAHVVLATGFHSDVANIPDFEGLQDFKGPILHSTQYSTASDIQDYKSKKFVVIGSSSSANDVAQDLATTGVDVTMVQRDANCVYSMNSKVNVVGASFMKPGISTEDGDILVSSMPFPVAITLMVGGTQMIYQMDKELLDRVGKTGFKFLKGDDGRGLLHLLFKKGGG
jgi:cation diffusion facilitator CzcD-associated flavoprotein CzcO